jgi:L-2,4-diaminobutyrate decarboxylase
MGAIQVSASHQPGAADWPIEEFDGVVQAVAKVLREFVASSRTGQAPVVRQQALEPLALELDLTRWIESGAMSTRQLVGFLRGFLGNSPRLSHPGSLAHQVAVPDIGSIAAELVMAVANSPGAIYEMGPAATATELAVIRWMLTKVGWTDSLGSGSPGGVLTHGGSLGNLTCLLAARARATPEAWVDGVGHSLAVLAPRSAHYSVRRAVSIMGLGTRALHDVAVDAREVIDPDRLPKALHDARRCGRHVVALVANACATSTGLHDPLDEIGQFCNEEGIWFHVDAAHGGSALVSPRERHLLDGIDRADSVVWDAHKLLRTSGLCTAALFRDSRTLRHAFRQDASYLHYEEREAYPDLNRRTLECTKTAMALKVFLNIALRGEKGLATYVEAQYDTTRRIYDAVCRRPEFECLCRPEANILCFRYGDNDQEQIRIREQLLKEGRFHVTSTEVNGSRWLRLTVMNPVTTPESVAHLLIDIVRIARQPKRERLSQEDL